MVSVFCITYNHVNFIRDAIEGFLMQETTFPVEIFIHDDASTDGTADIVREYVEKYPKLFWAVLQTENQWSKGNKRIIFSYLTNQRGQFVAHCEGDDYWTDPRKIEIQWEFLTQNMDYVATVHDTRDVDQYGNMLHDMGLPLWIAGDSTREDLLRTKRVLPIRALMHRNIIKKFPHEIENVLNGDNFLWILLGENGGCKFLKNIKPSHYRVHNGGVWQNLDQEKVSLELMNTYFWIMRYFSRTNRQGLVDYYKKLLLKKTWDIASSSQRYDLIFNMIINSLLQILLKLKIILKSV